MFETDARESAVKVWDAEMAEQELAISDGGILGPRAVLHSDTQDSTGLIAAAWPWPHCVSLCVCCCVKAAGVLSVQIYCLCLMSIFCS